jgi:hypothetical protein
LFQSDLPKVEDTIRKYEKISTSKQILWGKEMKMAYVLKMGMENGLPSQFHQNEPAPVHQMQSTWSIQSNFLQYIQLIIKTQQRETAVLFMAF